MDRSHKGEVQCTGIITLACLIFELVPFVVFHTWILFGACPSFTTWGKTGVSCDNLPLLFICFNLLTLYQMSKFSTGSELKACADDKMNVTEKLKFVLWRIRNTVGKGENAGYQHFLLFPQCFQKASQLGVVKSWDCVVRAFLKLLVQFWWNFTVMFLPWSSSEFVERNWFLQNSGFHGNKT